MGDSQQPKPATPPFEVPDLELAPIPRRRPVPIEESTARSSALEKPALNRIDEDFLLAGPSIDLGVSNEAGAGVPFGSGGAFGELELERNEHPELTLDTGVAPHSTRPTTLARVAHRDSRVQWPSGEAPARERLALDPLEVSLLANFGPPPQHVYATLAYAYRVFQRQRELKSTLRSLEAEREHAELERENTLAELARAVRADAECVTQLQHLFAPLLELERVASARGQALSSVNSELTARANALEAELATISAQLRDDSARESDAQRLYDEHDAAAKRADAKLKRTHIEIRALTQVAPQKPGSEGGRSPEPERSLLANLHERARALELEVDHAKAELARGKAALERASARVGALRRSERLVLRKERALVQHYQQELDVRTRSMTEGEQAERRALVDLGRAVLGAQGSIAVSEPWLERVRSSSERADALTQRCELHLRAQDAYDRPRAAQGVRLAGTLAALVAFLVALKLAL